MHAMQDHPSVVMQSELVTAAITPRGAAVHCLFVFRNDGSATKVKMGFPESAGGDIGSSVQGFRSFRSLVDGKAVLTKIEGFRREEMGWSRWRTKTVRLAAGQIRRVVVEYRAELGEISDGSQFFSYTLSTGASWKGKIGYAKIVVRFRGMRGCSTPDGGPLDGADLIRERHDLEPTHADDLMVTFLPPPPPVYLNGKRLSFDLKRPPLPNMRYFGNLNDRDVILPARWLAERIGARLSLDQGGKSAILRRGEAEVYLITAGSERPQGKAVSTLAGQIAYGQLVIPMQEAIKALRGNAKRVSEPKEKIVLWLPPLPKA